MILDIACLPSGPVGWARCTACKRQRPALHVVAQHYLVITVPAMMVGARTPKREVMLCAVLGFLLHSPNAAAMRKLAQTSSTDNMIVTVWHVTVGSRAPDCFQRGVLLVNGAFQPTLEVTQGHYLKVCNLSPCSLIRRRSSLHHTS